MDLEHDHDEPYPDKPCAACKAEAEARRPFAAGHAQPEIFIAVGRCCPFDQCAICLAERQRERAQEHHVVVALDVEQIKAIKWCRARTMTALAGMIEQGTLAECLDELCAGDLFNVEYFDIEAFIGGLSTALRTTGWMK